MSMKTRIKLNILAALVSISLLIIGLLGLLAVGIVAQKAYDLLPGDYAERQAE